MKTNILLLVALVLGFAVATVSAVEPYYGMPGYGYGYGGYGYHSSTYEEGVLRGSADLVRAEGDYNYQTSRAAINYQEALSRAYDNKYKRAETYFRLKELNQEYVAKTSRPRATQQELAEFAKAAAPDRLNPYQYEPAFGKVFWPTLLEGPQFAEQRAAIESLMASRDPVNSGLGSENHRDVRMLTLQMQETLKGEIHTASPSEYVAAKKFLTSLEYEAQHRQGISGVASTR